VEVVFATVIVLWLTRELHAVPGAKPYDIHNPFQWFSGKILTGWGSLFKSK
jgi:hypothetical protein